MELLARIADIEQPVHVLEALARYFVPTVRRRRTIKELGSGEYSPARSSTTIYSSRRMAAQSEIFSTRRSGGGGHCVP